MPETTNRLKSMTGLRSLFLQTQAEQPVDWCLWSTETFARAEAESKPIVLHVGCRDVVARRDSGADYFEDERVAELLNENFVSVCVDSDENPDVAEVFLEAVRVMNAGFAHLPLTVFLTPQGLPFYGGSDFSLTERFGKPSFVDVCSSVSTLYQANKDELEKRASRLVETLARATSAHSLKGLEELWDDPALTREKILLRMVAAARQCFEQLDGLIDREHGGFRGTGKDVHACLLPALMFSGDRKKSAAVLLTLEKMRCAAVHDPVDGGFFHRTQDSRWMRPTFVKSLTDNAQLLAVYAQASAFFRHANPLKSIDFESTAREIFSFLEDRLKCPSTSLYFDGESDDSGDEVSEYYGLDFSAFEESFADDPQLFEFAAGYFALTRKGLVDGKNVLARPSDFTRFCNDRGLTHELGEKLRVESLRRLRAMRAAGALASRTENIVLSDNALAASSLIRAAQVVGETNWLSRGLEILNELSRRFVGEGQVLPPHMLVAEQRTGTVLADDFAYWLQASVDAYCATGLETYAIQARQIVKWLHSSCVDPSLGILFSAPQAELLFARPLTTTDSVRAASSAVVFASCRTFLAVERASGALERREPSEVKMWEALELVALATFAHTAQSTPQMCATGLSAVAWAEHQSVCCPDSTSTLPVERWLAATRRFWQECLVEAGNWCVLSNHPSQVAVDGQDTSAANVVAASNKAGDTLPTSVALVLSNVGGCYESTIKYVDMVDKLRNHPIQEG